MCHKQPRAIASCVDVFFFFPRTIARICIYTRTLFLPSFLLFLTVRQSRSVVGKIDALDPSVVGIVVGFGPAKSDGPLLRPALLRTSVVRLHCRRLCSFFRGVHSRHCARSFYEVAVCNFPSHNRAVRRVTCKRWTLMSRAHTSPEQTDRHNITEIHV